MPEPAEEPRSVSPQRQRDRDRDGVDRGAGEITLLLGRMADGDQAAVDELFKQVYGELRRIARGQRRRRVGASGAALETTALIHEAYLRFVHAGGGPPTHREHFFAVAARAMRQILLDEAKHRLRHKRGGGAVHTELDPQQLKIERQAELMITLDRGLEKLGRIQRRARRVFECRYFGGLSEKETATALGVDVRTIRRDWAKARAWLAVELGPAAGG